MAKVKVLFGQMRGKVGGSVFRHDPDGYTVVSEYNPQPANPRTVLQTEQRNKMNLAGCMSRLTPYAAIAGLNASKRKARSMFVSNIIRNSATNPGSNNSYDTLLNARNLKISEGRNAVMAVTPSYAAANNTLTVSVANADAAQNIVAARVVLYIYGQSKFEYCVVKDASTLTGTTASDVTFTIPAEIETANGYAHIYVVPIFGDDAAAITQYRNFVDADNSDSGYQATVSRTLKIANAFGASLYEGSVDFTA